MARWWNEQEYHSIVSDILDNPEFRRLADYQHHGSSILDHVRTVSHWSYILCKGLGLDYRAAARAGLLHDFFLYDWREYKRNRANKNHGLHHPKVAVENAMRYYALSELEKDIILKHMWPKCLSCPLYPESWIVSGIDKVSAYQEFLFHGLRWAWNHYKHLYRVGKR